MAGLRVSVSRLRRGMIITENVYNNAGVILVTQETPVTKEVVDILSKHFIDSVMIRYQMGEKDSASVDDSAEHTEAGKQFEEFKESFIIAENTLTENLKDIVYNSKDVNVSLLLDTTNQILQKSNNEIDLFNMLRVMKKNTESLYTHSINVSIFGQILAKWVNCTQQEIENVAVAGLLHDIGILKFPEDKLGSFTFREEMENGTYEKHVIYGYNLIKDQNIDNDIKQAVLTHHERMNGSGFPLQVRQDGINKISRILAIADIYDTYTMKEEGVQPMSVFAALKHMENMNFDNILDSQFLMKFTSNIAQTIIHQNVLLSDGRTGKVIMINQFDISRPLVQVGMEFVDLSKQKNIQIRKILD